jgi:hypothetical protein
VRAALPHTGQTLPLPGGRASPLLRVALGRVTRRAQAHGVLERVGLAPCARGHTMVDVLGYLAALAAQWLDEQPALARQLPCLRVVRPGLSVLGTAAPCGGWVGAAGCQAEAGGHCVVRSPGTSPARAEVAEGASGGKLKRPTAGGMTETPSQEERPAAVLAPSRGRVRIAPGRAAEGEEGCVGLRREGGVAGAGTPIGPRMPGSQGW